MATFEVRNKHKNDILTIENGEIICHGNNEQYFTIPIGKLLCITQTGKKIAFNWLELVTDETGVESEKVFWQELESQYATRIKNEIEAMKLKAIKNKGF